MRAIVQHGPRDLRLEQRPQPEPGPGQLLVRVLASGICGSDLHFWREAPYGPGTVLGHELAGEVAALGPGVEGPPVGTRGAVHAGVSCGRCDRCLGGTPYYCKESLGLGTGGPYGGLGEYLVAPARNFLPADDVDPAALTLAEPLANGLRCLTFLEGRETATAVVIGCGPLGLSCLVAARAAGVGHIWGIEGRPRRRQAARMLGAERVLDPSQDPRRALRDAFPQGVDLVIEAVGHPDAIESCFKIVRHGGDVVLMGVPPEQVSLRTGIWMVKELTIRSSIGCDLPEHRESVRMLAEGRLDARPLVTRRIGLEEVPAAMAALADGADEIKVVVEHETGA